MPVTTLAARLPDIGTVRRWSQSLALLDAILSPEWAARYYAFDSQWAADEQMASMRNGSGDGYSIVFTPAGAYARGFDHESELSPFTQTPPSIWPGVVDDVPPMFRPIVVEPAFTDDGVPLVTVCLWRTPTDTTWKHGTVLFPTAEADPDGADWLFNGLDGQPETYQSHARDYFEQEIELEAISHIYRHQPLTNAVLSVLNPELSLLDLDSDLHEIGYLAAE